MRLHVIFLLFYITVLGCKKEVVDIPSLSTNIVSEITTNSAKSGGTIISTGGGSILSRGVCWSTTPNPSILDDFTSDGNGTGSFVSNMLDLQSMTLYYIRAYTKNEAGVAYGETLSFETLLTANDMLAEGYTIEELLNIGISVDDLIKAGVTVQELVNAGALVEDMLKADVAIVDLLTAGVSVIELVDNSVEVSELLEANAAISDLLSAGITVVELLSYSVSVSDFVNAEASISEMLAAGITVSELYNLGISVNILLISGASFSDVLDLGLSIVDLFNEGVGVGALKRNGITYQVLMENNLIGTVDDFEGNVYRWVKIGDQFWMAENLKSTKLNCGVDIQVVEDVGDWRDMSTLAYCWYDNDQTAYKDLYGALYNWHTIRTEMICPIGWHVPDGNEWITLIDYVGDNGYLGYESESLKANNGWYDEMNGTDDYGFEAYPGGYRAGTASFKSVHMAGYWWTYDWDHSNAWYREIIVSHSTLYYDKANFEYGLSIRCVKD